MTPQKAKICKHARKKYDYLESLSHKKNIYKVWEVRPIYIKTCICMEIQAVIITLILICIKYKSLIMVIIIIIITIIIIIIVTLNRCEAGGSMSVCHAAGPRFHPRLGQVSWVRFFGVFLIYKTSFRSTKVPEYNLAVIIILFIHLVRMNGCANGVYLLSCSCCLRGGPDIQLIPHLCSPSMFLEWSVKYYVIQS